MVSDSLKLYYFAKACIINMTKINLTLFTLEKGIKKKLPG